MLFRTSRPTAATVTRRKTKHLRTLSPAYLPIFIFYVQNRRAKVFSPRLCVLGQRYWLTISLAVSARLQDLLSRQLWAISLLLTAGEVENRHPGGRTRCKMKNKWMTEGLGCDCTMRAQASYVDYRNELNMS